MNVLAGMVRSDDPDTSHAAAARVDAGADREKLKSLFSDGIYRTAREAALELAGPGAPIARVESLRRRVSDLVASGYLERIGVRNRERLFGVAS